MLTNQEHMRLHGLLKYNADDYPMNGSDFEILSFIYGFKIISEEHLNKVREQYNKAFEHLINARLKDVQRILEYFESFKD